MPSGNKYVGSSIDLPIRVNSYFNKITPSRIVGKFLPLLKSKPIQDFTLEVMFTPKSKTFRYEMIIEQYFLLMPEFNLNTIRVSNNPSGHTAKSLFMYNRDGTICYFKSNKHIDFVRELGIHKVTLYKHLEKGTYYLGKYMFSLSELVGTVESHVTLHELRTMLDIDRVTYNKSKELVSFSVAILLRNVDTAETHSFPSLGKAVKYLRNMKYPADQRTLVKRLNTNIPYHGYIASKKD